MSLAEALRAIIDILKGALAAENKWTYLLGKLPELIAAVKVVIDFVLDLMSDKVMAPEGIEVEAGELMVLLADVMETEQPRPQFGVMMWIAIVKAIITLIGLLKEQQEQ